MTPYQPSVSTLAALSAPGWLQVEAGVQRTLVATSYSISPALVVDAGVSKGLSAASGGWSVFTG